MSVRTETGSVGTGRAGCNLFMGADMRSHASTNPKKSPSVVGGRVKPFRNISMMIGHWGELKEAESRRVGGRLELGGNNVMRRRQSSRKLDDLKRIFEGGTEESQEDSHSRGKDERNISFEQVWNSENSFHSASNLKSSTRKYSSSSKYSCTKGKSISSLSSRNKKATLESGDRIIVWNRQKETAQINGKFGGRHHKEVAVQIVN